MEREVSGPVRGVANSSAYIKTPMDLVPIAGMMNTRLNAPESDRPRFGQRPGLVPAFPTVVGGGNPVQAMGVIQRSSGVSSYQRTKRTPLVLAWTDGNDVYRYSRKATRFKRTAFAMAVPNGSPFVAFVFDDNLAIRRSFGLLTETADPTGVKDANTAKPLAGYDRPGAAGLSDIIAVSGRYGGGGAGKYDEQAASLHRVVMGLQTAWHPQAGVAGDTNEHTMIFTVLVAPGVLTTAPAGYTDGCTYTSISAVNVDTGAVLWRNVLKDYDPGTSGDAQVRAATTVTNIDDPGGGSNFSSNAPNNIVSTSIEVTALFTFVCAGAYIYTFNTATGEYLQRIKMGNSASTTGWAKRTIKTMVRLGTARNAAIAGGNSLLCVFEGTNDNAASPAASTNFAAGSVGPLPGTNDARFAQPLSHWRSGVAEFNISSVMTNTPLTRSVFPSVTNDGWAEPGSVIQEPTSGSTHYTLRLSSVLNRSPRGGLPFAACKAPDPVGPIDFRADDPFFIGFTNKGYGVTSAAPTIMTDANYGSAAGWAWPDDVSTPPTVVAKFDGKGTKLWEVDAESLVRTYDIMPTGSAVVYHNDIPSSVDVAGPMASVMAMRCDSTGNLYIAGLRNGPEGTPTTGFNVRKLDGANGSIIWRANLKGKIYMDALRISPIDGSIFVVGERNDDWESPAGRYATLWKLSSVDGSIIDSYDFGLSDSLWSPAANSTTLNSNGYLDRHSAIGIDIDRSGRVAITTTPGV